MKKFSALLSFLFSFAFLWGTSPVPYSGKIDIRGVNYFGQAQFTFSLYDGNGTTHWRNGTQAGETIQVSVHNGRYTVLLGGQGMTPFPPRLFLDQDKLYLKVHVDTNDSTGLNHLGPDQMISATPRALAAEWAKMAILAEGVTPGAITRAMLSAEVLADLNRSGSESESNATFTPTPGSITRSMLASDVQFDLNRTVSKTMLGSDVLADLNRTITKSMLGGDVLADLNRTVTKTMLGSDVLADLNAGLSTGSVTRDKLSSDIVADLNQSIKTITRDMLPASVLTDLNRTITKTMLGSDVLADLNRTVTANDIAANTITTAQLNESVLKYLKPEITQSPQVPAVVYNGQSITLSSQASGKYLSYQWQKDGADLVGENNASLYIGDTNATLHDGNYTLVVSNDFGSVVTQPVLLDINQTSLSHQVDLNATVSMEMLWVSPGTFTMGSPTTEAGRGTDETQHTVTLSNGFYLGKYEVTQAQYEAVMIGNTNGLNAKPSQWSNNPNRPVEKVSWEDVQIFLSRLNSQQSANLPAGWKYVLPTEAQWEYACRAGTTTAYLVGE